MQALRRFGLRQLGAPNARNKMGAGRSQRPKSVRVWTHYRAGWRRRGHFVAESFSAAVRADRERHDRNGEAWLPAPRADRYRHRTGGPGTAWGLRCFGSLHPPFPAL